MSLSIEINSCKKHFCELSSASHADSRAKNVKEFLESFKKNNWDNASFESVNKSNIIINLPLVFLCALLSDPDKALSYKEKTLLEKSKSFKRKTQFFLSTPGGVILVFAAIASGVAGGAAFYYGIRQASIDLIEISIYIGIATAVAAIASNILGFYITGLLPHNASETENKEQNMWDDYLITKTKPAAFQLLEWYSPQKDEREEDIKVLARRSIAKNFIEELFFDKIINYYKSIATQDEKIDIAFRCLIDAKEIINSQMQYETKKEICDNMFFGELTFVAKSLGYFK